MSLFSDTVNLLSCLSEKQSFFKTIQTSGDGEIRTAALLKIQAFWDANPLSTGKQLPTSEVTVYQSARSNIP